MSKLSAVTADRMVELIADAGWPVGAMIATESELKERFGVSRAVIREALGLVELRGIAAMKSGKGGGLVVSAPAWDAAVMALATFLEVSDARLEDMISVMQRLESLAVDLAIDRIDEDSAALLEGFAAEMIEPPRDVDAETATFRAHRNALATASRNPVLAMIVAGFQIALAGLSMARVYEATEFERHLRISKAVKAELLSAVLACDPHRAQTAIRSDYGNQLRSIKASGIGTMSRINADAARHGMKLPRWIALKISRRIADHALAPGEPLGSEAELMAQFGVGRSVLREAIRMLEAYSVVAMKRGKGGGLRVAIPDPESTFQAVVPFLRSLDGADRHAFEVRTCLEVEAAGLAAQRRDGPSIDAIRSVIASARERAERRPEETLEALAEISRTVVAASGDRVLEVIAALTQRVVPGRPSADIDSTVFQRCDAIAGALAAGDAPLARRLVHVQLRAVREAHART
ncbi:FadR/GntR family transcriptional regulator [Sphingosinicella terrae]|uniref:FadR/GntR family transcriptional regulator n=1 Tax=Sphingosinicella terrae TaxID=2172047 RepID=UPI0013B3F30F|nr:GntR family transcriptional regulator [Sphingosinicella terrae]